MGSMEHLHCVDDLRSGITACTPSKECAKTQKAQFIRRLQHWEQRPSSAANTVVASEVRQVMIKSATRVKVLDGWARCYHRRSMQLNSLSVHFRLKWLSGRNDRVPRWPGGKGHRYASRI